MRELMNFVWFTMLFMVCIVSTTISILNDFFIISPPEHLAITASFLGCGMAALALIKLHNLDRD